MKAKSIWLDDTEIILRNGLITTAEVAPECCEKTNTPELLIDKLKKTREKADLLVFGQRFPDTVPRHHYHMEWEDIAVIPITDFNHWREKQITKETRKNISKAAKKGVVIRVADFDDDFVNGILSIYNESPVRQGKPFLHYKKDFDVIKREHSTYLEKSDFIGAYYNDELIGFIKLFYSDQCASTMQVISKIEDRDKKSTNALLAKAVEICSQKGIPYLQYGQWSEGGLGDFKRYNGFERISIPIYYIPLTTLGNLLIRLGLHQGLWKKIPESLKRLLKNMRKKWNFQKN